MRPELLLFERLRNSQAGQRICASKAHKRKARRKLRQLTHALMTYHNIATNAALWAEHTDGEPFTGTLAERLAFLEVLFHYEAQDA